MSKKTLIAPSLLACSKERRADALRWMEQSGVGLLHIDVMDGEFVEATTSWNKQSSLQDLKTSIPLHLHLMVVRPHDRLEEFLRPGITMISFHPQTTPHPEDFLQDIRAEGISAGITLNPEMTVDDVGSLLPLVDHVLIMSVQPGKIGQDFIIGALDKIRTIRANFPDLSIIVDGGINIGNVLSVFRAGANIAVVGAAIFTDAHPQEMFRQLQGERA